MTTESKPIKRSIQLAPLSRDHHEALSFVWKIKQGIKSGVSIESIAADCIWFFQNKLKAHFKIEEELLSKTMPLDHPMMIKMLDDHKAIESKIKQLQEFPSIYGLERLAQIITYHIRYEERVLYNEIEQLMAGVSFNLKANIPLI